MTQTTATATKTSSKKAQVVMLDGNEAAAYIAHKTNEICAIYPITPSSPMGEWADAWSAAGKTNIWGTVPLVTELQSESGASGAVHGALQAGALTTTFTASQGLLMMIPNMFKIAGELTPTVFHVSARSLAYAALSIFADHSDVMATRTTGFAMLASNNIQEIMDLALIAQAATLESRVSFMHFFDGFRSSHEINKVERIGDDVIGAMIDDELVIAHRRRALSPDHPVIRGTAQNPDVYFQGRETVNRFYDACPAIVQKIMDKFAGLTGRQYKLFDYVGAPDAERVIAMMCSGAETADEAIEHLVANGEKVGLLKVRLFRPFSVAHMAEALPTTVKILAAMDRTKESGAAGDPLYLDLTTGMAEAGRDIKVVAGRYGLASKEFTPGMVKGIFDNLAAAKPKSHFTIGINDDVTHSSIDYPTDLVTEPEGTVRCMFYGLGADGTVGANKNSIKIIGEETDNYAQGYFVYDSKKAGAVTVSHLRFGPKRIRSTYLVSAADFIACHQFMFMEKFDVLGPAVQGATFLLNSPYGPDEVWDKLPRKVQQEIIDKQLKFYVIDGYAVAEKAGMGQRVNTIMQTCFFAISGILPPADAIAKIKEAIKKTYGKKGDKIVQMNYAAVDAALEHLHQITVPAEATSSIEMPPVVSEEAPEFVQNVTATIMAGRGDELPVSAMPEDGTWPTATTQWEKRNIALHIPEWDSDLCIQCGKCSIACPHGVIRMKIYDAEKLTGAPEAFGSVDAKGKDFAGKKFTIQVAPEDCTGCSVCVSVCPAKDKQNPEHKAINMVEQIPVRQRERENFEFFLSLPDYDRSQLNLRTVKGCQLCRPLFEFSGACAGCGETPYVKLLSQLYGDRALIANATGCSSIYGGNLPTTPWAVDPNGRGPSWSNSLFEDNAEFGFGFRLTVDKHTEYAREILAQCADRIDAALCKEILEAEQVTEADIAAQRQRVAKLKEIISGNDCPTCKQLLSVADMLVAKSVWILGGDGWAYDIGYGGLDHVLASGRNVNVLVMDTEVYSNTGGQMSKATPRAAVAKFAAGGKPMPKKDLAMMAMTYGNIYVARVAMGASDVQTLKAFIEAEAYDGPSLIIAYSNCIAHGIDMSKAMAIQKQAVACGHWPLMRFDPRLVEQGKNPLQLDSKDPTMSFKDFAYQQTRFSMLTKSKPDEAARLIELAQADTDSRWHLYKQMAEIQYGTPAKTEK